MMPDREKVNRGLHQHCECSLFDRCGECPYYEFSDEQFSCRDRLLDNVLELLKEQEAKPMIEDEHGWNCPSCGMKLIGKTASGYPCDLIDLPEDEPIHFCPKCGRAVKWE